MKMFKIAPIITILLGISTVSFPFEGHYSGETEKPCSESSYSLPGFPKGQETLEKANRTIRDAVEAMDDIMSVQESRIPPALLSMCEGIVIFPGAFKLAVGALGGQGGRGIAMIRKEDGSWSNPFFIWMGEGSVGAQIGAQFSDIVLLFQDRENILRMEEAEVKLGSDLTATAGPENKEISASTDVKFESEIYSYSRSKGLFAGVSISGAALIYNDELNDEFYSKNSIRVDEIFYEIETPFNKKISDLIETLNKYTDIGYKL